MNQKQQIRKIICSLLAGILCLSYLMPWTAYGTDDAVAGDSQYTEADTLETDGQTLDSGQSSHSGGGQSQPKPEQNKHEIQGIELIYVSTAEELLAIAERVNAGDRMEDSVIKLMNNISLKDYTAWRPIGADVDNPFCGTFDGGSFTVSNIAVAQEVYGGLFGFVSEATIKNLNLYQVSAEHSTRGMFFAASNTLFEECYLKNGPLGLFKAKVFFTTFSAPWNGTQDTTWYNAANNIHLISKPEHLAGLYKLVDNGNSFAGKIVILTDSIDMGANTAWVPIGGNNKPFSGTFQAMDGAEIHNLRSTRGGVFHLLERAVVKNVKVSDAYVTFNGNIGALANFAHDSSIQGCTVSDSYIECTNSNAAGGVVGKFGQIEFPAYISQCLVENCEIKSVKMAGGVVGDASNRSINQNIVYRSSVRASYVGGITPKANGEGAGYSSVSQNLVFGIDIAATYVANSRSALVHQSEGSSTIANNFITNISLLGTTNIATNATWGVDSTFTDAEVNLPLVTTTELYVQNNYWDSTMSPERVSVHNKGEGYSTHYLTNGIFNLNDAFWQTNKHYYPRIRALGNSNNPRIVAISALASVPLLMMEADDTLEGTKGVMLHEKTMDGLPIAWQYSATGLIEVPMVDEHGEVYAKMLSNPNDANVVVSDLKAVVTVDGEEYYKTYPTVTIVDGILYEDEALRVPDIGSTEQNPVAEALSLKPQLTYLEPVEANPNAAQVYLEVLRSNNQWQVVGSVDCSSASQNFILSSTAPYTATFDFTDYSDPLNPINPLYPGSRYRVILPAESVKELNKDNYSPEIVMYFQTASVDAPRIAPTNRPPVYTVGDVVPLSDAVNWFTVYNKNTTITPAVSDMQVVPSGWISGSIDSSVSNILTQMSAGTLPGGDNVSLYYVVDGMSMDSAVTDAGFYTLHVFAVNASGITDYRNIRFSAEGQRGWAQQPATHRHMLWTEDRELIKSVALLDALGVYTGASGTQMRAQLKAEIDDAQWQANATTEESAFAIDVSVCVLKRDGVTPATAPVTVTVYLDKATQFRVETTWLSASAPSSTEAVENLIRSTITHNRGYDFTLEHTVTVDSAEPYKAAGEYRVNMHVTPSDSISLCSDPSHIDVSEKTLEYTVVLVPPYSGGGIKFWDKVMEDIENFNDYIPVTRNQPPDVMPYDVMGTLQENIYNNLELDMGEYRWKFYGHAVKDAPGWRYSYPLGVEFVSNKAVSRLTQGYSEIQFKFDGEGRLFTDARLDIKIGSQPGAEWTLYHYDATQDRLVFVFDAAVDGKWAQTVIDTLEKDVYVLSTLPYNAEEQALFTTAAPSAYGAVNFTVTNAATGADEPAQNRLNPALAQHPQEADAPATVDLRIALMAVAGTLTAGVVAYRKYGQKRGKQNVAD